MSTREIVTLQIGHYSNFVGSHWWNCQEASFVYDPKVAASRPKEVNHDVLYREGITLKGETTFTPRLVAFDLNHSLGSMRREGVLYDISSEEDVHWDGDVALHQQPSAEKNPYLLDLEKAEEDMLEPRECEEGSRKASKEEDETEAEASGELGSRGVYNLDDKVKVWSDYLRTSLHARTVHLIDEHQHNNPEQPFDVFGVGESLLSSREKFDAVEDRIRFFTEECDYLQGFQILVDTHNAFGGFASPILNYLVDEYPSSDRLSISLSPACLPDQTAAERSRRMINSALGMHACTQNCDLHLPLTLASKLYPAIGAPISFPHLQYKANLDYHTSAILASALDTFSMPYRRHSEPLKMGDITSTFNRCGRKLAALSLGLPLPLTDKTTLADYLFNLKDQDPWISLTPDVDYTNMSSLQICMARGFSIASHQKLTFNAKPSNNVLQCSSVADVWRLYLRKAYPTTASVDFLMQDPLRLDPSFPHIFKPVVGSNGYLSPVPRPPTCGVESVPMLTSLQTGNGISDYVTKLVNPTSRFDLSKHHHFVQAGLQPDDFKDICHQLTDLGHCYDSLTENLC